MTRYRVSEGDRLSAIAQHFNTTTDAIVAANPTRPNVLLSSGERVFASLAGGDEIDIPMLGEPKTVDASNAISCSLYSASAIWDTESQQCFASGADMEEYYTNIAKQGGSGGSEGSGGGGGSTDTNPSKSQGGGSYGGAKAGDMTSAAQPIERSPALTAGISLLGGLFPAIVGAAIGGVAAVVTTPKALHEKPGDSDAVYDKKRKATMKRTGIGAAIGGGVGLAGGTTAAYMLLQRMRKAADLA